eukprot:gene7620-23686_t
MKGVGTNEAAVWAALRRVWGTAQWAAVQHRFRERHATFSGGRLRDALADDLSKGELAKARRIVEEQGAEWDA